MIKRFDWWCTQQKPSKYWPPVAQGNTLGYVSINDRSYRGTKTTQLFISEICTVEIGRHQRTHATILLDLTHHVPYVLVGKLSASTAARHFFRWKLFLQIGSEYALSCFLLSAAASYVWSYILLFDTTFEPVIFRCDRMVLIEGTELRFLSHYNPTKSLFYRLAKSAG